MIDKKNIKEMINFGLILILLVFAFFIIRPVFLSIIFGILLAYVFYPLYLWILRKTKNRTLSASFVCVGLIIIFIASAILILGALTGQALNLYLALQKIDLTNILREAMPKFFSSDLSSTVVSSINSAISVMLANSIGQFGDFIINLPTILLQAFIVIFTFFFALRDGEDAIEYIKSLSPLNKENENKFFRHFKDITYSVLIGQIVIGIFQGIVSGIGYFIFGVPNALVLTLITVLVGVLPIIGPWLVWVPVDIYLFSIGKSGAGLGLLIYGLVIISWLDTILRPIIVSRRTQINSAVVIIGMIGGLFAFGILGLIIGPLVLAYVLLTLEIYRKKTQTDTIIFKESE